MGRKEINMRFSSKNFIVTIDEDTDAYLYAAKDNEDLSLALRIRVYRNNNNKKGEYICSYYREYTNDVNSAAAMNFIKKFLEDVEYRKEFLSDTSSSIEFNDVISIENSDGVNTPCRNAINRFYKIPENKRKFKDYANIKTFGLDKFSKMKIDTLSKYVDEENISKIKESFEDEPDILAAIRWCARGLECADAIRKINTDNQIKRNIKR